MGIQSEEILINNLTSGTTLLFFGTHLNLDKEAKKRFPNVEFIPTILHLNNLDIPYKVTTFDGSNVWSMNSENTYVPITALTNNYLTGYSYTQDYSTILSQEKIDLFEVNLKSRMEEIITSSTTIFSNTSIIGTTASTAPYHKEYVLPSYHEIEDFYVNIKLQRSFDTLNTLSVYNNMVNSFPTQESDTGVVFGRLVAKQSVLDPDGNKVSIPLKNVLIGIFNPSDEFPYSSSVNLDGDRLFLNIKESSKEEQYFNKESFKDDYSNFLRSESLLTEIPEKYKHITTTNENGEFIIYDAPIGNQILVFEVDLFKQGLSKDEIALNYFPFPANNENVLDRIPNFLFKQFPIDIVPAWGTIQTGYTQLDITTNFDLRKWTTYYVPPMAYDGRLLGSADLLNFSPSLNISVRDMSVDGYPLNEIPIVEIHDIYTRKENQKLIWDNEFAQLKNKAAFYSHGFKAFKVPANMYDPNSFRTDSDGAPRAHPNHQGVWLSGYQIKYYYNQYTSIFRTTGFQRNFGFTLPSWRGRDHYHRNRGISSNDKNFEASNIGGFPYEKRWTYLYPEKYSIPKKPEVTNFDRASGTGRLPSSAPFYLEQPEYKDGDLIGKSISNVNITYTPAGGLGVQFSQSNNSWFENRFSKEVTYSFLYKYESGVAWNEQYSNGYEPSNSSFILQPGVSSVLNGEKYQRIEGGYGYILLPDGWNPVSAEPWGDTIFSPSTNSNVPNILPSGTSNGNIQNITQQIIDVYNIANRDLAVSMDNSSIYSEGALNIYRIIDPSKILDRGPSVISTSAKYFFSDFYFQRGPNSSRIRTAHNTENSNSNDREFSKLIGGSPHATFGYNNLLFEITNNGSIDVSIPSTSVVLGPGDSATFDMSVLGLQGSTLSLPGNSGFNFINSTYDTANYTFKFKNIKMFKNNGSGFGGANDVPYDIVILGSSVASTSLSPTYHLTTSYNNVRSQLKESGTNSGCRTSGSFPSTNNIMNVRMNGALFNVPSTSGGGNIIEMKFLTSGITPDCGEHSIDNNIVTIPMQKI